MSLHHDPVVDRAMRALIGSGSHFWDPDNMRFHKSKPITGVLSKRENFAFVVERYGTVFLGGHCVQTPHSRVIRVSLKTGALEYMGQNGRRTISGSRDEKGQWSTNAQALKAATLFAKAQR